MSAPRTLTAQLKPLVQDLAKHRSVIYWGDLLLTTALFWGAFTVYVGTQVGLWGKVVAFVVAVFSLYRAATFMHEIVHLPQTVLPGFRWAWNLLCGIPILLPSFLYYSHIDHHATRLYATIRDPEYLPFGKQPLMSWLTLIVGTLLSPPLLWLRFAVLVPLAWFSPRLRRWLDMNFSSVVIHPHYRAETPRKALHKLEQQICEPLAMLYAWVVLALSLNGYLPMHVVVSFIAIATCVLLINALRTRYAHRYEHSGKSVSHAEQIEDSVTLNSGPWLALFVPLGLRFHALHHLFPYLPYHALGVAHQRLIQSPNPAAEIYRQTCRGHNAQALASNLLGER